MANPNIVNVANIYGKIATADLTTTSATQVLSNASGSGVIIKVNALYVANVNATTNAEITLNVYSAAALGGTPTPLAYTVVVPFKASLVIIDKNSSIYLPENTSLGAIASVGNYLEIVCSYEEIS